MRSKRNLATLLLALSIAACGGGCIALNVHADDTPNDKVATSSVAVTSVLSGWTDQEGCAAEWTESGAKMIIHGNTTGSAWTYSARINGEKHSGGQFSVADGKTVDMKFKIQYTDEETKSNNGEDLDIIFYGFNRNTVGDGTVLFRVRQWTNSASNSNRDFGSDIYVTGGWDKKIDGQWIVGNPFNGGEYHFAFNKTELLKAEYASGLKVADENNTLKNMLTADVTLSEITDIWVMINGDNGFTKNVIVTLTELNGQSLANSEGSFTDTVAPILFENGLMTAQQAGVAYTLPCTASDLLCASPEISVDFKDIETGKYVYDPETRQITFNEEGNYTVDIIATDAVGNSTTKTVTFAVEPPAAPTISAPTVAKQSAEVWGTLSFPFAVVGSGIVESQSLAIYKNYNEEEPGDPDYIATATDEGFALTVPVGLTGGTYTLVYTATNSTGSDVATTTAEIAVEERNDTLWASSLTGGTNEPGGNTLADLTALGVRIRSTRPNVDMKLGFTNYFSAKDGITVTVAVPDYAGNKAYANARPQLTIYNPTVYDPETNPGGSLNENGSIVDNYLMYGVWLSGGSEHADSATNVYIFNTSYGANTWNGVVCDCEDTGWIKNDVIAGYTGGRSFQMSFDTTEYFTSISKEGAKMTAENAAGQAGKAIDALLRKWGDIEILAAAVSAHNEAGAGLYDFTVTEVNGVSLAAENGAFTADADPVLFVGDVPKTALLNDTVTFNVFGADPLSNAKASAIITPPSGEVVNVADASFLNYTFSATGSYTVTLSITGANGKTEERELTVLVKDKVTEFDLTLVSDYASGLSVGETVTVIDLADKTGVAGYEITVKNPDGTTATVSVGDTLTLSQAGGYVITYLVYDDALPARNEAVKEVRLNARDMDDPVITAPKFPASATVGKVEIPAFSVEDATLSSVTVTLILPDGTRQPVANGKNGFSFNANTVGTYKVEVTAVDDYDNSATETFTFEVKEAPKGGCSGELSPFGIVGAIAVLTLAAGVCLFVRKKTQG